MMHGIQMLPTKMAQQYAARWKAGEGWPISEHVCEFVNGNTVICICVFGPESPMGHMKRDPHRAEELRKLIAGKTSTPEAP